MYGHNSSIKVSVLMWQKIYSIDFHPYDNNKISCDQFHPFTMDESFEVQMIIFFIHKIMLMNEILRHHMWN
jgi:hypothetical protein